jgi:Tfp pilus assembly protein PilV
MRTVSALVMTISVLGVCGCQKPLFPKDAPRTQYEAYDRMRSRYTPLEEPDVFGNPQPALRARLSPMR